MAILKRLDTLDVATSDLSDAVNVYKSNFHFSLIKVDGVDSATLAVGDAVIRLVAGEGARAALAANGEGLAGLWLEAGNVDEVAAALKSAGIEPPPIRIELGRRILALDPAIANQVPLFICDRRI